MPDQDSEPKLWKQYSSLCELLDNLRKYRKFCDDVDDAKTLDMFWKAWSGGLEKGAISSDMLVEWADHIFEEFSSMFSKDFRKVAGRAAIDCLHASLQPVCMQMQ